MIEKVIIFTIRRAKWRSDLCWEKLLEIGVPEEMISVYYGVDSQDFQKTRALMEFAINTYGFTFLHRSLDLGYQNNSSIADIAQFIAYLHVLRDIAKNDMNTMIIFDDHHILVRSYTEIQTVLAAEVPEDFYAVSIPQDYQFKIPKIIEDLKQNKKTWDWKPKQDRVLMNGLQTPSESGLILSPGGAQFIFDLAVECLTHVGDEYEWTQSFQQTHVGDEYEWTHSFQQTLDRMIPRINHEYSDRVFSFNHEWVETEWHYDFHSFIYDEAANLLRPIAETKESS